MSTKLNEFGGFSCLKAIEHEWHETGANAFTEPYGFTGKEYEKDLGITYFGARFYNPQTTRWLSPDPLYLVRTAKNAEKDQNVYQYGANNPWKFVDPDGLCIRGNGRACGVIYDNRPLAINAVRAPFKLLWKLGVKTGIYSKPGQKPTKAESLAVGFFSKTISIISSIIPDVIERNMSSSSFRKKIKKFGKKNRNANPISFKLGEILSEVMATIIIVKPGITSIKKFTSIPKPSGLDIGMMFYNFTKTGFLFAFGLSNILKDSKQNRMTFSAIFDRGKSYKRKKGISKKDIQKLKKDMKKGGYSKEEIDTSIKDGTSYSKEYFENSNINETKSNE